MKWLLRISCIAFVLSACGTGTTPPAEPEAPTCTDGVKNGSESDVDCGGTCPACGTDKSCSLPADCTSGVCTGGKCAAPSCTDAVKNGTETGIDCGGSCPTCR
jgi:hypothetical protein